MEIKYMAVKVKYFLKDSGYSNCFFFFFCKHLGGIKVKKKVQSLPDLS